MNLFIKRVVMGLSSLCFAWFAFGEGPSLAGDNFNDNSKDLAKWAGDIYFGPNTAAALNETNGRLEFIKPAGVYCDGVLRPWLQSVGSYTQDWEAAVDVYLGDIALPEGSDEWININLLVSRQGDTEMTHAVPLSLDLYRDGATLYRGFELTPMFNGMEVTTAPDHGYLTTTNRSGRLQLCFAASNKVISAYCSGQLLGQVDVDEAGADWGMTNGSVFVFSLVASTGSQALGVSSGQVFADNFQLLGTVSATGPSQFSSATLWRSLEADGPALFEVDVSAPTGKTITVTVPTVPTTVYNVSEDEFAPGEYEYYDPSMTNAPMSELEAQYPQGDYVLRIYSDAGKTALEESLVVSFGTGASLPFPEVYPALTQPVPAGDQLLAEPAQTYTWSAYSGTAGTATHMTLEITGNDEVDEYFAFYDATINGSTSYTPPTVPLGDYDLELMFFFRQNTLTPGGTLVECRNERYSRYALTVTNVLYQLSVNNGSGSGTYTNGAIVAITADAAPAGQVFDRWTGATQYVGNVFAATTTVTMPAQGMAITATYLGQAESLFSSVTIWRSLEADGPAVFEVDVSAPTGTTITVTVPTVPVTVYDVSEDEFAPGEYEYYDPSMTNAPMSELEAQYPQGDYVLRIYSDAGKTTLEETLVVSFGTGASLPFPEEFPALTQPVPSGDQILAEPAQTYTWPAYSGTAGTATHMALWITGNDEADEYFAEYDAAINGSASYAPPTVPFGDYDLELAFLFRQNTQTPGGTLVECANERYSRYALTVTNLLYQLTVNNGSGSGTYTNSAVVAITADAPSSGQVFDRWTGATQYVANVFNTSTMLTMPAQDITVTATYQLDPAGFFTYITNSASITITGYTGPGGAVVIPDSINGFPVTSIGNKAFQSKSSMTSISIPNSINRIEDWAFSYCHNLSSVVIPNSVTDIGNYAFAYCNNRTNVTLGSGVTRIGYAAFCYCSGLLNITIPDSLTSIGSAAFSSCPDVTNITVGTLNTAYSSSAMGVLFDKNQTQILQYPAGRPESSYTIPDGVSHIGESAFSSCAHLTSVTIPDSVVSIGWAAFRSCTGLASVIIPEDVTDISGYAFFSCNSLTNMTIGANVTNIRLYAFFGCTSLTSATIGTNVASIGNAAFRNCASLDGIYFYGNAPGIGTDVFTDTPATAFRLAGATGWPTVPELWAGRPTAYWGSVPAPVIGVSGNLAFGNVTTGTTATATMTIANSGDATLTVTGITYPSGFSGAWSGTLAAGHATNVTVTFTPVALTAYSGTVTVNSDATSGTSTLSVSGTGTIVLSSAKAITTFKLTTANSGTLINGPTWVTGRYGTGLSLSGSQYASVPAPSPDIFNITGDLTISLWVKPNTVTCSGADPAYALVSKRSSNHATPYELYIGNGGSLWLHYYGTNIQYPGFQATGTITTGAWQHIAVTRSFSGATATVTFYINGVEAGRSTSVTGLALGSSDPVWLGKDGYHTTYTTEGCYSGLMDEVQIYNRVLSGQEVSLIVSNNSSSIASRVGNWRLDESSGSTATDTIADGSINEGAKTIAVLVPTGTAVTALVPRITTSPLSTVAPLSGVAQNFSAPVLYTVTAQDFTTQSYTVTVANSAPLFNLTVINGSGSVACTNGSIMAITAGAPALGYLFDGWTGDTQYVASVTASSTTVTMPAQDIVITAAYVLDDSVLVVDTFGGASGSLPDASKFEWSGEVTQNGAGELYMGTSTVNTSWLRSKAGAAPTPGQLLVLQMRLAAYAEPAVYGDLQPRGLRVGGDPNNAIEFYSVYGTTLGMRVVKNGVVSQASYAFPSGVQIMHNYEISVTTTQVVFKVDGVVTGTFTENIPVGNLSFYLSTYDGGFGNVPVLMDSMLLTLVGSPTYVLTVNNGSGSGTYTNGTVVAITADEPIFGKMFAGWTGATQYVSSVSNAMTSVTMPGAPVTLTATYQLIPVEPAYFDSFEATQLNPFWVTSLLNGTIAPSADRAHEGVQSAKFSAPGGGQKYLYLRHFFERPQYGTVSVWVYDSMQYIYFGMLVNNSALSNHWGAAIFNMDWDYGTFYYTPNMQTSDATKSAVVRSVGWRKFTIRSLKNELVLDVDGQEMYRGPGVEPFDSIQLHLSGPSSGTIYFDEFSFVPEIVGRVADPVFEPASGLMFTNELVATLSCATAGASIYYTTDGSEPTEASALYEAPLVLTETTTLKAKAFKASYYPSEPASALFTRAYTLADAVDCRQLVFRIGGEAPWFIQSAVVFEGTNAVQSGAIGDRQSSWMETSVEGPGTLSFHWKVSCEDDTLLDDWDYVAVTVNGVEVARRDGVTEWELVQVPLAAGVNTVRWTYTKDRVVSEGMDCAWVDRVSWTPPPQDTQTTPVPVPHLWLDLYTLVLNGDYETAAFSDEDGDGHLAWEEYVAGTYPDDPASVLRVHIHFENGLPVVTWDPDHGSTRNYHVEGRASLSEGEWEPATEGQRFFRVRVEMPGPVR